MSEREMTVEEYEKYFELFDPVDYKPEEWVKLAKRAGMKYAVLTAKHHDGFCLFDSALTDYKATNTKAGRDLVKELVTNYGKLDILWFDFSYDDMCGEKWRASELIEMVRRYQPDVVIDNRLEGSGENHGSIAMDNPLPYSGDFASPEQIIPPEGIRDVKGELIPWELCATMNNHWGYCNFDYEYKPAKMLIRKLVECVSKGGNMILNVGPDARGRIPEQSVKILNEIGGWMDRNGESIYGCGISSLPKPEWGRYTQKGNVVYAHVFEPSLGALPLYGIAPHMPDKIHYLADGSEVRRGEAWNTATFSETAFVSFGENLVFTYPLPDKRDTVLRIELC